MGLLNSEQVPLRYWPAAQLDVQALHTVLSNADVAWQAETRYWVAAQVEHGVHDRSNAPPHVPVRYEPAAHVEVQLRQEGFDVAEQVPDRNVPAAQSVAWVHAEHTRSEVAVQGEVSKVPAAQGVQAWQYLFEVPLQVPVRKLLAGQLLRQGTHDGGA